MQIYKFNSVLKPVLWGGDKLVAFKGLPACDEPIGESWELSGMPGRESVVAQGEDCGLTLTQLAQRYGADLVGTDVYRRYGDQFPLLIKLIDAKRDLSVQVHPDDEYALAHHGSMGKTEMWYVLQSDEGAIIRAGFNRSITLEEFDRLLADGTLLDVVNATAAQPGDVFFIPPGEIHTIGAGNFVVEIQESSDITYRVWDYGRRDADGNLRQLHIEQAREALNLTARDSRVPETPGNDEGMTQLVRCDEFDVRRLDFTDGYRLHLPSPHSFVALVCLDGETELCCAGFPPTTLRRGETALLPAIVDRVDMSGSASLLLASVPNQTD